MIRQLVKYKPMTDELRRRLIMRLKEYLEFVAHRLDNADKMKVRRGGQKEEESEGGRGVGVALVEFLVWFIFSQNEDIIFHVTLSNAILN